jgi:uroporphyrinogen III methyltransferase / synthase
MSTNSRPGTVYLVGAGPGDPGLLTLRAAELLRSADVLLYDALASDAIVSLAPSSCERIFVGKRGGNHAMPQAHIEELAILKAREDKRVVRLKGGDPFVFGRGAEEAQTLRAAGIPFEIVPGISSAIAAPAYAGIPVTHRSYNPAFTVATGHEDPTKAASTIDWARLADPHRTLVLLMAIGNLREIAAQLVKHGLAASTPVAVIQDGTRPTQRTVVATLETIAERVAEAGISAPAITIVGDVVRLREEIAWFERGPLFGKRVLVTRPAHQAASFAAELYSRGIDPILAATIVIEPPDDPHAAHHAVDELAAYAWIVFSSQNAVDVFFDRLASLDADARYLGHAKVAAIGTKTAAKLRDHGIRADLVPAEFVSEEIGRALIEASKHGDRVLVFRAQDARDVLPEMLEDAGLSVTTIAAYKTRFVRDPEFAEKTARADIITFASASAVAGFVEALGGKERALEAASGKVIACIGPVTAEAAQSNGLSVDITAEVFTTAGLLDALEAHYALEA